MISVRVFSLFLLCRFNLSAVRVYVALIANGNGAPTPAILGVWAVGVRRMWLGTLKNI